MIKEIEKIIKENCWINNVAGLSVIAGITPAAMEIDKLFNKNTETTIDGFLTWAEENDWTHVTGNIWRLKDASRKAKQEGYLTASTADLLDKYKISKGR